MRKSIHKSKQFQKNHTCNKCYRSCGFHPLSAKCRHCESSCFNLGQHPYTCFNLGQHPYTSTVREDGHTNERLATSQYRVLSKNGMFVRGVLFDYLFLLYHVIFIMRLAHNACGILCRGIMGVNYRAQSRLDNCEPIVTLQFRLIRRASGPWCGRYSPACWLLLCPLLPGFTFLPCFPGQWLMDVSYTCKHRQNTYFFRLSKISKNLEESSRGTPAQRFSCGKNVDLDQKWNMKFVTAALGKKMKHEIRYGSGGPNIEHAIRYGRPGSKMEHVMRSGNPGQNNGT